MEPGGNLLMQRGVGLLVVAAELGDNLFDQAEFQGAVRRQLQAFRGVGRLARVLPQDAGAASGEMTL